jgi:hypothetical protein
MQPAHAGQPGEPPDVSLLSHGYQYLTEQRYDQMEPVLELIRRDVVALGLPLRSIEVEFGPSQCEFTFAPARVSIPQIPWCCSAAPGSRFAVATAITPPSCAARAFPMWSRRDGICISQRWSRAGWP